MRLREENMRLREANMRLRDENQELKSPKKEEEVECENCVKLEVGQLLSDIAPNVATFLPHSQAHQWLNISKEFSENSSVLIGELVRMRNELREMI